MEVNLNHHALAAIVEQKPSVNISIFKQDLNVDEILNILSTSTRQLLGSFNCVNKNFEIIISKNDNLWEKFCEGKNLRKDMKWKSLAKAILLSQPPQMVSITNRGDIFPSSYIYFNYNYSWVTLRDLKLVIKYQSDLDLSIEDINVSVNEKKEENTKLNTLEHPLMIVFAKA